ncbi:hypothetical protein [Lichenibacterium ramalinae]|uniref:hypothetical protein n=1 Tax=Lichenibacterium ramalinae TaxID=2316527 RepID=UPI00315D3C2C
MAAGNTEDINRTCAKSMAYAAVMIPFVLDRVLIVGREPAVRPVRGPPGVHSIPAIRHIAEVVWSHLWSLSPILLQHASGDMDPVSTSRS